MWDYKVIAGKYTVANGDVTIEIPGHQPAGLQSVLDHFGGLGFDLTSSNYDNMNREIVLLLKKPKDGYVPVGVPVAAAQPAAAAAPAADDELPPRRRGGAKKRGGRRSKAELDRLYRDT